MLHSLKATIKASWKREWRKTEAKVFKGNVTLIRWLPVYANIGGPDLQRLFNKSTGNSVEFKYLDPGVTILIGLSLISPGCNLSCSSGAFGLGIFKTLVEKGPK